LQKAKIYIKKAANKDSSKNYGTGSKPCPPQGWHLLILLAVNQKPFIGPYFLKACMP
jgi:hypothetical protein